MEHGLTINERLTEIASILDAVASAEEIIEPDAIARMLARAVREIREEIGTEK